MGSRSAGRTPRSFTRSTSDAGAKSCAEVPLGGHPMIPSAAWIQSPGRLPTTLEMGPEARAPTAPLTSNPGPRRTPSHGRRIRGSQCVHDRTLAPRSSRSVTALGPQISGVGALAMRRLTPPTTCRSHLIRLPLQGTAAGTFEPSGPQPVRTRRLDDKPRPPTAGTRRPVDHPTRKREVGPRRWARPRGEQAPPRPRKPEERRRTAIRRVATTTNRAARGATKPRRATGQQLPRKPRTRAKT